MLHKVSMTTHSTALHSHNEYGVGSRGVLVHVGTPGQREEEGGTGGTCVNAREGEKGSSCLPNFPVLSTNRHHMLNLLNTLGHK